MSNQLAVPADRQDVTKTDVNHSLELIETDGKLPRISQSDYLFLTEVLHGLSKPNKSLPCKYFYNEAGSKLFEDICELDEYYVTREEKKILNDVARQLKTLIPRNVNIIEPGSGAGEKVQILLNQIDTVKSFTPLEISPSALAESAERLRLTFPDLRILPLQGDFTDESTLRSAKNELDIAQNASQHNLLFFPGSTIGNFDRSDAVKVLNNLAVLIEPSGSLLIGYDLIKNEFKLTRAYDDAKGVTSAFNKNLLTRINSELYGTFDVENGFVHSAVYNRMFNRVEMHLVSTKDQKATVGGHTFWFRKGETIHTESSHKYSVASFTEIAKRAGFSMVQTWTDPDELFAVSLLRLDS